MGDLTIRQLLRRSCCLIALLAASACREAPRAPAAVTLVDDGGDSVHVVLPARRVASLIPATTELFFAIGAGDVVVGRTNWCNYPAAAALVPNLGDGMSPNIEAIVAARPDLVVLYRSAQNEAAADRLRSLGIPAIQLRTDSLSDVGRLARMFGRLTGHVADADSMIARFERELAESTRPAAASRPSVFLLVWNQPPMTVGAGSYISELIERAGGRNVFEDLPASSGTVSIEAVTARNPDFVLTFDDEVPAFARQPEWQSVRAVRERRFVSAKGSEFDRPSPRAPQAVRALAARLAAAGR
jgi:ABC-type Fe3+-hydroxamate transport system substrate-binding protein